MLAGKKPDESINLLYKYGILGYLYKFPETTDLKADQVGGCLEESVLLN